MEHSHLTWDTLTRIAWAMSDLHGPAALDVADRAIDELDGSGAGGAAQSWRSLRALLGDIADGRLSREWTGLH